MGTDVSLQMQKFAELYEIVGRAMGFYYRTHNTEGNINAVALFEKTRKLRHDIEELWVNAVIKEDRPSTV